LVEKGNDNDFFFLPFPGEGAGGWAKW